MYSFTGQGAISRILNDVCNKTLCLALENIKTVNLEYCLLLSVARLVRFWFESLPSLTTYAYCEERVEYLSFHVPCFVAVVRIVLCNHFIVV